MLFCRSVAFAYTWNGTHEQWSKHNAFKWSDSWKEAFSNKYIILCERKSPPHSVCMWFGNLWNILFHLLLAFDVSSCFMSVFFFFRLMITIPQCRAVSCLHSIETKELSFENKFQKKEIIPKNEWKEGKPAEIYCFGKWNNMFVWPGRLELTYVYLHFLKI